MWIQLLSKQVIEIRGVPTHYQPGDWVEVGKMLANKLVSEGAARPPNVTEYNAAVMAGVGVVTPDTAFARDRLAVYGKTLEFEMATIPSISYAKTIWYDPSLVLRPELVSVGVNFLDTWEVAVPFSDYKTLALNIGSDDDREKTKKVIRDLRVPVYDTRLIFVRHTKETERLFATWNEEMQDGGDTRLAFMRAVYKVKPFLLALPCSWVGCNV